MSYHILMCYYVVVQALADNASPYQELVELHNMLVGMMREADPKAKIKKIAIKKEVVE